MKKFYRFLTVLVAVASIGFFGCHHSFQEETPEKAKTGYGNLTVKFSGTPEEGSALENCSITVSGFGMTDIRLSDATGLASGVALERIPVGKNRVVLVRAKKTIKSVLENLDGTTLYAVADINDGETTTVTVGYASSAVGSVFYELIQKKFDVSSLTVDEVKSHLPSGVKPGLINTKALAEDIKNKTIQPQASYKLNGGTVSFTPMSTLSDVSIHVNDGASGKLTGMTSGSPATISGVAPGTWTFYIIQNNSILYEKQISVSEGQSVDVGSISLKTPNPRLENADGSELTYFGLITGEHKTVYLNCRTVDGEAPLDADIYYTLDGSAPTDTSSKYTTAGITVSIGTKLKAFALKPGLVKSDILECEFVLAGLGKMHPTSGAFSPVGEENWKNESWELGAHISGDETTFALYSANASKILLEIYENAYGSNAKYDYWMQKGSDDIWRAKIKSAPKGTIYAFRCWGPNWTFNENWARGGSDKGFISDVDADGNRFNPNKVLFDPYTREMTHDKSNPTALGSETGGIYGTGADVYSGKARRNFDTGKYAPKGYVIQDNTSFGTKPNIPQEKALIYEAHVRGITKHPSSANLNTILSGFDGFDSVSNIPEDKRGTYAGAALLIPYLKGLGINTIELLPVHETDNDANPDDAPGGNFWGYMTYGFFAPDRRYSSDKSAGGPTKEFKEMVSAFHEAGMEVYLDVVYNHTGEGGLWGTGKFDTVELTFMHGIDNSTYYSLTTDKKSYWESTGCGNNMQCDNSVVQKFILDSLSYWIKDMGVDGFRFDLATVLGREKNAAGDWVYNQNSDTLKKIVQLGNENYVEMIAESWDCGSNSYQVGNFPQGWGGWNGRYRDAIRSYIGTGNRGSVNDFIYGDYDHFNNEGGPHKSVNFIVAHDGFTLADLCSYAGAGNAQNQNVGWPFGPSDGGNGDTNTLGFGTEQKDKRQAARNYIAVQMMSRGVPMIVYGDEFGRTQNGNNNPYNIDSVATWNNYNMINTASPHAIATGGTGETYHNNFGTFGNDKNRNGNFEFAKYMMKLRASEPALNQTDYNVTYEFKKENGTDTLSDGDRCVWLRIKGSSILEGSDYLVFMNMYTTNVNYAIPAESGYSWVRLADTANWAETDFNCWNLDKGASISGSYGVAPWSVVILKKVPTSSVPEQIKTPVIKGNTPFASNTSVTIECETSGAEIYYTTDGTDPTSSSQKYNSPIPLSESKTIKAVSKKDGRYSDITTKSFVKGTVAQVPKGGVMIQAFNWASAPRGDSSQWNKWYNVINDRASDIKDKFAYAWFPPPGKSSSDSSEGYAPTQINDLNNYYGTEAQLKTAISALSPCKAVADIVINHRGGTTSWGDFTNPDWGVVKGVNYKAICSDDEGFVNEPAFMGSSASDMRGAPDTGEKYAASRDLDHTNLAVQQGITTWMNAILRQAGFYGWRYDFVKGFDGKYVGQYNRDTLAEFSVGEYWPTAGFSASNPGAWGNAIKNWVEKTEEGGSRSRAFDFALKGIMNNVFGFGYIKDGNIHNEPGNNNYGLLADQASLMKSQPNDAVTFVDNHDTGSTQKHWFLDPADVGTAYSFILTHPGFPCVAWQHYFTAAESGHAGDLQYIGDTTVPGTSKTYRQHIDYLIDLRKTCGIEYDSPLEVLKAENSVYAAKITGKSGELVVVIGTEGVYAPSGVGYDNNHAVYGGTNFTIWHKGEDGTYGAGTPTTYTVTGMPSFWGDAGAVQYVWIFDGTDGDHWVNANFDSGTNSLTFSTVWNFTKLITVRMDPSHLDLPSWDAKWNKSKDLSLSGNTAVYQGETP